MQDILLLHGAIGAADQLIPLEKELADSFSTHHLNFSGHGGSPFTDEQFSIKLFAAEVISFLNEKKIDRSFKTEAIQTSQIQPNSQKENEKYTNLMNFSHKRFRL